MDEQESAQIVEALLREVRKLAETLSEDDSPAPVFSA
jgi:hypothetical protein